MKRVLTLLILLTALCAAPLGRLKAQAIGGTVSGKVTDGQGVLQPNIKVEIENTSSHQRLSTVSDANGQFTFANVPVGRYRLITTSPSSTNPAQSQEVTVSMGGTNSVNLVLTKGPATDALVSAEAVPVSMSPANIQRTYETRKIQYLAQPNFMSRQGEVQGAYNLSLLTEGLNSGSLSGSGGPAVGGQRPITNNYHVDGIDNNNKVNPGPLVYVSNEATNEFALFQNQPAPYFGHSSGGKFNSMIRSGNNAVHGSLYDYLQNRNLNAVDSLYARQGIRENPRYDQNRLGGSLGLPIIPSKLFVFGNFEYIPLGYTAPLGGVTFAPTPAGFALLGQDRNISATNLGILQSSVGTSVGPAARFTTINGVSIPLGQVVTTANAWQNQFMGTGAMDFTPWEKDAFHARYVHNEAETNNANGGLPGFLTGSKHKSLLASLSHYHSFENAVVNELRLGYNRFNQRFPGSTAVFPGLTAFPNIQIEDANLALGQQLGFAQAATMNTFHLADNVSARIGRNEIRIGFDGRRYLGSQSGFSQAFGNYGYSSIGRFLQDLPPDITAQRSFGDIGLSNNQWLFGGYLQDHVTVLPNLTVEAGVRYEYATIPEGLARQQFNTVANGGGLVFSQPHSPARNFAPYVGFALSPTFSRMTVFRGGFGMYYDQLYGQQYPGALVPQSGFIAYNSLQSTTRGFLQNGGIRNPVTGPLTTQQARALTSSFVGDQRSPYSMQWNFAIEQQIWHNFTAEVKYLGSRNIHLPVLTMLNNPGIVTAQNSLPLFYSQPTQAQLNALPLTLAGLMRTSSANPLVQAGFTSPITSYSPDGTSTYHGLAITLNHRFTGGFQFLGNYTWSHLIDDSSGTLLDLGVATRERANSLYDRRHRATATIMWEPAALFKNSYSVVRNVFADFSLSGTYSYESPQNLTPLSGIDTGLTGLGLASRAIFNPNGTAGVGSGVTALRNSGGQIVGYQVDNPNAQFVRGAAGIFVNGGGRNGLSLNETNNWDLSAVKRFSYAEKFSFELRGDAYNVFNHPQFTGGQISSIGFRNPLSVPVYLIPGTGQFGDFQSYLSNHARVLQVALRVVF